jgi:hypothetical protein
MDSTLPPMRFDMLTRRRCERKVICKRYAPAPTFRHFPFALIINLLFVANVRKSKWRMDSIPAPPGSRHVSVGILGQTKHVEKTTYKPYAMLCYVQPSQIRRTSNIQTLCYAMLCSRSIPKGCPSLKVKKKTCVLRFPGGVRPKMLENT